MIAVPVVIILIIIIALAVVLFVRYRRRHSGIPHERFRDEITEHHHDGMNNQLFDMNLQPTENGGIQNGGPSSQDGDKLKLSKNGSAYYAKTDNFSDPSPSSFANPLYNNPNVEQTEIRFPSDQSTSTA